MPRSLHWQIAAALLLSVVVGATVASDGAVITACGFVGTIFLNALKMVVVPLIASSIIHAMLGLGGSAAATRMGARAIAYYLLTCLLAVVTGLLMVDLIEPGIIDGQPAHERLGLSVATAELSGKLGNSGMADIVGVFQRMVPANIVEAAAKGDLLGVVFFCLVFGFFAGRLAPALLDTQKHFWDGIRNAMLGVTGFVMRFAPIGVFALVTKTVSATGWGAIKPLALLFVAVIGGLAVHLLINLPLTLWLLGRASPTKHFRAMTPALLTAFSSSSSVATLPVTLDCLQNRAGISPRVTSFVLPLGASINLDGSALYECAVAMFIAQAYGVDLSFSTQFLIVLMATVTSMGVAGIPSASLVAIAVILTTIGLPLEGLGVILAVDRVLDMCRTAVNVFGDSCGAVVVARLEGEADRL